MDSPVRQLIRGTYGNILVKGAGLGLTFTLSLWLARMLGAQGYGHFAYVLSWGHLLSVVSVLGLDVLLTREIARAHGRGDDAAVCLLHRWSYAAVLGTGLLVTALFAGWAVAAAPPAASLLLHGAALIPLLALLKLHQGALQGASRPVLAQIPLLLLFPALTLGAVLALKAAAALTEHNAVSGAVTAAALAALAGAALVWRGFSGPPGRCGRAHRPPPWRLLASALPLASITLFSMFNEQAGVLMLGLLSTPDQAGVFDMVRKLSSLVPFVLLTTTAPLAPQIARLHAAGDHATLQRLLTRGTQLAFAGSLLVTCLLLLLGHWLLELLGPGFDRGYGALVLLCAAQIFNAAMGPVAVILNMTGHERDVLAALVLAAGGHLLTGLLLIPHFPLHGAAIALALNLFIWNGLLGWRVRRRLGVIPWLRWR